jgi:predicted dienelactone hydrolase
MVHRRFQGPLLVIALSMFACGGSGAVVDGGTPGEDAATTPDAGSPVVDASPDAAAKDASTDAPLKVSDYGVDGPDTVTTANAQVTSNAGTFTERMWIPSSAGAHPVVSLSPGLQQPAAAYAPYGKRLASWGFVVVMRDDPGIFVNAPTVAADIAHVVNTWLPAQNASSQSPLFGKVDTTRVGLAGHSRGGQATLLAATGALKGKVKAWFGLDPVDSSQGGMQARTALPQIGIPTTFLGAGVTGSCAPAADNYEVLYAQAPSPSVKLTGVGAGHVQFEDPAHCFACGLCTPAGTANSATVLAYSVRYLTAFFARELLGDASVGATFQGAGAPADVGAGLVTIQNK